MTFHAVTITAKVNIKAKIAAAGIGALVATSLGVKALKSGGGAAAAGRRDGRAAEGEEDAS